MAGTGVGPHAQGVLCGLACAPGTRAHGAVGRTPTLPHPFSPPHQVEQLLLQSLLGDRKVDGRALASNLWMAGSLAR